MYALVRARVEVGREAFEAVGERQGERAILREGREQARRDAIVAERIRVVARDEIAADGGHPRLYVSAVAEQHAGFAVEVDEQPRPRVSEPCSAAAQTRVHR